MGCASAHLFEILRYWPQILFTFVLSSAAAAIGAPSRPQLASGHFRTEDHGAELEVEAQAHVIVVRKPYRINVW
jgi:hypothetical protein